VGLQLNYKAVGMRTLQEKVYDDFDTQEAQREQSKLF
jgi:hypothetical protein